MLSLRVSFLMLLNFMQAYLYLSQADTLKCYVPILLYSFNSHTAFCVCTLRFKICKIIKYCGTRTPILVGLILTATPGLALLHGKTPHAHLESRDGHERWCSAAVDRWAVHNNPQSVDPFEQSRIDKKISKCQVSSFCSLKITLSTQSSFFIFQIS